MAYSAACKPLSLPPLIGENAHCAHEGHLRWMVASGYGLTKLPSKAFIQPDLDCDGHIRTFTNAVHQGVARLEYVE